MAAQLITFPRHLSQHPGGFVLTQGPLTRLVPVENAAMPDRSIIQWDKDDLDAVGLLKVDVLALGMLSAIRRCLALVSARRGVDFRMQDIPGDDPATWDMICAADTVGVFQIESRAQMSMLPRLKPRCFYDLVIEVAIVRPGPIQGGMVHPYLRRRQGLEPVEFPQEALREALGRTLGVPIFQEQVMQIAMLAAGFSAGEADSLRRSMAAWKRKGGVHKFHERIVGGMVERGYTEAFAQGIFRQIEGFGEYGFPESHAASFALLVWVSCWLKRHEPAAFLAAMLNSQPLGFYTPSQLVQDARRHHIEVRPIDVTTSDWDCTLEEAGRQGIGRLQGNWGRIPIRSTPPEITPALHPNRALTPISHPPNASSPQPTTPPRPPRPPPGRQPHQHCSPTHPRRPPATPLHHHRRPRPARRPRRRRPQSPGRRRRADRPLRPPPPAGLGRLGPAPRARAAARSAHPRGRAGVAGSRGGRGHRPRLRRHRPHPAPPPAGPAARRNWPAGSCAPPPSCATCPTAPPCAPAASSPCASSPAPPRA